MLTPVITLHFHFPSSSTSAGRSRGLVTITERLPHFMNDSVEVRQKMWYIGSGAMMISAPSLKLPEIQMPVCSRLASMLRWVSIAPLATPVVPPVYCRNARSSRVTSTGVNGAAWPRASAARNFTVPPMCQAGTIFLTFLITKLTSRRLWPGSRSPTWVVITCSTGVLFTTCCRTLAKFSRMTMARAPESFSWCSSSRGVYIGLTLTTVMPARRMPNSATGYCSRFGDMIATRSPRAIPGSDCR